MSGERTLGEYAAQVFVRLECALAQGSFGNSTRRYFPRMARVAVAVEQPSNASTAAVRRAVLRVCQRLHDDKRANLAVPPNHGLIQIQRQIGTQRLISTCAYLFCSLQSHSDQFLPRPFMVRPFCPFCLSWPLTCSGDRRSRPSAGRGTRRVRTGTPRACRAIGRRGQRHRLRLLGLRRRVPSGRWIS